MPRRMVRRALQILILRVRDTASSGIGTAVCHFVAMLVSSSIFHFGDGVRERHTVSTALVETYEAISLAKTSAMQGIEGEEVKERERKPTFVLITMMRCTVMPAEGLSEEFLHVL